MILTKAHLPMSLHLMQELVYRPNNLALSDLVVEKEGKEYDASRFTINEKQIIYRRAKITPKKMGQFVTFWKRNANKITEPFSEDESFDYYVIFVQSEQGIGSFVFPKSVLIEKGIVSTHFKEGKRGFRVYLPWDLAPNKQAVKTQKWQVPYFMEISDNLKTDAILKLYDLI
jgi:hypothetical protein